MAMSYIIKCGDPPSDIVSKVQTVVARVTQWRTALRKGLAGRVANRISKMEELSTDVSQVMEFLNNENLNKIIVRTQKGDKGWSISDCRND